MLMTTIPMTQTKRLKINAAKMIDFPIDYIGLIRIGKPDGDRVRLLMPSSKLARVDENDKSYVPHAADGRTRFNQATDYWTTQQYDSQLPYQGQGHNNIGYYYENISKRRIELSVDSIFNTGDELFVEYVADGCGDLSNATEIYAPAVNMLKQWANYRWAFYKLGAAHRETQAQHHRFKEERDEYKAMTSNLSADTILAAINQTAHIGPKF